MRECWAAPLGGCSKKLSREHIVSKAVFPGPVFVQGLDYCMDEPKMVGDLWSHILCKTHNEVLSPLDTEAGRAFKAFQEFLRLLQNPNEARGQVLEINGPLLERWFLKTLINCNQVGKGLRFVGGTEKNLIPMELLEIAFGKRDFQPYAGLYSSDAAGDTIQSEDRFNCVSMSAADPDEIIAGRFIFRGHEFLLNLDARKTPAARGYRKQTLYPREGTARQLIWACGFPGTISHTLRISGW